MRGHGFWRPSTGRGQNDVEIERLRRELTAYNELIEELEQQYPEGPKIEALKAIALSLAQQIDELRCSKAADELTDLLSR
jgi:capsule polysaccharide export protein KpsE/RkpR